MGSIGVVGWSGVTRVGKRNMIRGAWEKGNISCPLEHVVKFLEFKVRSSIYVGIEHVIH